MIGIFLGTRVTGAGGSGGFSGTWFKDLYEDPNDTQLVAHTPDILNGILGVGNPWASGGTSWTIQGNAASNTPTEGGELVTDPGFADTTLAAAKNLVGITKADPGVITLAAGHGYVNGQVVYIEGVANDNGVVNDLYWKLRNFAGDTCEISDAGISTWDTSSKSTLGMTLDGVGGTAKSVSFTSWGVAIGDGIHPGVDGSGALTSTVDFDGEQSALTTMRQNSIMSANTTNKVVLDVIRVAGTVTPNVSGTSGSGISSTQISTQYLFTTGTSLTIIGSADFIGSIDDVSVKELTLNETIATVPMGITQGTFSVPLTIPTTNDGYAGMALCVDSVSNPQNYLQPIYNIATGKVELNKFVAGVRTSLIDITTAYGAAKVLSVVVVKSGSDLLIDVLYDGVAVGTQQTVSDAGIVGNTLHGVIAVDADATPDSMTVTLP